MSSLHRTGVKSKGFTLIELLVAIALAAIVLTALYSTFFTVFRAGDTASIGLDARITAARMLDRLTTDVHGAYFDKNKPLTAFAAGRKGPSSSLAFTTYTYPVIKAGYPAGDLRGVAYSAVEGDAGVTVYREVWNPFAEERVKVELVTGLKSFELSYFTGTRWVGAWDASAEGRPPAAVRVNLTLPGGDELTAFARIMIK